MKLLWLFLHCANLCFVYGVFQNVVLGFCFKNEGKKHAFPALPHGIAE